MREGRCAPRLVEPDKQESPRSCWEVRGPDGYFDFMVGTLDEAVAHINRLYRLTGQQYAVSEA